MTVTVPVMVSRSHGDSDSRTPRRPLRASAEDSESDSKDSDLESEFNFLKLEFKVIRFNASDSIEGHRARDGPI